MPPTLESIRNQIDSIDFEILSLLRERQEFVLSAAEFKDCEEGETGVIVPSRIKSMMIEREAEAERLGLDSVFVKELCKLVIDHMIGLEMKKWRENV